MIQEQNRKKAGRFNAHSRPRCQWFGAEERPIGGPLPAIDETRVASVGRHVSELRRDHVPTVREGSGSGSGSVQGSGSGSGSRSGLGSRLG